MNQERTVQPGMASQEYHVSTRTKQEDLPTFPVADHRLHGTSRGDVQAKEEAPMAPAHQAHAPIPEPAAPSGPLHVVVDLNRCQAYAQCCFLAPSVFKLHGEEALWYDPAPDVTQCEHVLRAAAACPVQAIFVEWSEATNRRAAEEPHEKS